MRPILYILLIGVFTVLYSCKKVHDADKYKGTYTFSSPVSFSDSTQCKTSPITIIPNKSNQLNFNILFGQYYSTTLTANIESSEKATILPIANIGVMSQGGFELFGGTLHLNNDVLILELDVIHYSDPNDPSSLSSNLFYQRHMETYTYKKD